jgi:hypothetical protein
MQCPIFVLLVFSILHRAHAEEAPDPIAKLLDNISQVRVAGGAPPVKYQKKGPNYFVETPAKGKPGKTVVIETRTKPVGKIAFRRIYTDVIRRTPPTAAVMQSLLEKNDMNFGAWSYYFSGDKDGFIHVFFFAALLPADADLLTLWDAIRHVAASAQELEESLPRQ